MADDLYERDFFLWTQAQAEALRSHGASNRIDWDGVAEELDDMGKRELRAVETLIVRIIEHLHKLRSTQVDEPRAHWRKEIRAFRLQVADRMTASLRARAEEDLDRLHERAVFEAERWLDYDDSSFDPLDVRRRWSLSEILGESDDPVPKMWNRLDRKV
jgi:hypothetical protein